MTSARFALLGAGPTATSLLERIVANAPCLCPGEEVEVHLVDPFPPGAGRVWRNAQSALVWTNSMAEDVTMFTDDTVRCEGPIVPGPSLAEWVRTAELDDPDLLAEARATGGRSFPTRRLQSAYLADVFERVRAAALGVRIVVHEAAAVDLAEGADDGQLVLLAGGEELEVDAVVLTLGHLDVDPPPELEPDVAFAASHGARYVPPAYTADVDWSGLEPGEPVLVRGMGLAFIDLMVLVTEGRGGRFVPDGDRLVYEPSGREPVLHLGSRRGVPYRSKPTYRLLAPRAPLPRFLDRDAVGRLLAAPEPVEFFPQVWPLLAKDVALGWYHELFHAHPERTTVPWADVEAALADLAWDGSELSAFLMAAVPDPADRLDVAALDRPLAGVRLPSAADLQDHLRRHVAADVARRTDPHFSQDLGGFYALLTGFGQLVALAGRMSPRSQREDVDGWWYSFFSYYASGPPPERLRQLLALSEAGVVQFLGADLRVERDESTGEWVASSPTVPGSTRARALVDARLPVPSVARTRSPLVRTLRDRGELVELVRKEPGAATGQSTGKVTVSADLHLLDVAGRPHPRRFAAGIFTSRPAAGTFARPRTNALSFRQNDALARRLLELVAPRRVRSRQARGASASAIGSRSDAR